MASKQTTGSLYVVPITLFILIPVTCIGTYSIAVQLGHVAPILPYISDTGTFKPQSSIFSQFLNISAGLILVKTYIRYLQVKELPSSLKLPSALTRWNRASLVLGTLTSLGLSVLANFQVTSVLIAHLIGAAACFGCGTGYFWMQSWISCRVRCLKCPLILCVIRFFLALANSVFFVLTIVGGVLAGMSFEGEDNFHWSAEDGGYEWHLVSTKSEWLCVGCFCLYILTFAHDFRNLELTNPRIIYKDLEQNEQNEQNELPKV